MEIFANTTFSKAQKAVYPPFFFWKHKKQRFTNAAEKNGFCQNKENEFR